MDECCELWKTVILFDVVVNLAAGRKVCVNNRCVKLVGKTLVFEDRKEARRWAVDITTMDLKMFESILFSS